MRWWVKAVFTRPPSLSLSLGIHIVDESKKGCRLLVRHLLTVMGAPRHSTGAGYVQTPKSRQKEKVWGGRRKGGDRKERGEGEQREKRRV